MRWIILLLVLLVGCSQSVEEGLTNFPDEVVCNEGLHNDSMLVRVFPWEGHTIYLDDFHYEIDYVKQYKVIFLKKEYPCYEKSCLPIKGENETRCTYEKTECFEDTNLTEINITIDTSDEGIVMYFDNNEGNTYVMEIDYEYGECS